MYCGVDKFNCVDRRAESIDIQFYYRIVIGRRFRAFSLANQFFALFLFIRFCTLFDRRCFSLSASISICFFFSLFFNLIHLKSINLSLFAVLDCASSSCCGTFFVERTLFTLLFPKIKSIFFCGAWCRTARMD